MAESYPRSIKTDQGAFVRLVGDETNCKPVVVPFQYNPTTVTRKYTPWQPDQDENKASNDTQSQPYDPQEEISLSIELDATVLLEKPDEYPSAQEYGISLQLAQIKQLIYPSFENTAEGEDAATPSKVPVTFFSWGGSKQIPVRITALSIEEQAFLPNLVPYRAKCDVTLLVLTDQMLTGTAPSQCIEMAKAAWDGAREEVTEVTPEKASETSTTKASDIAERAIGTLPFGSLPFGF